MGHGDELASMLRGIYDRPEDTGARLAFADWMDDRGDGPRLTPVRGGNWPDLPARADWLLDLWRLAELIGVRGRRGRGLLLVEYMQLRLARLADAIRSATIPGQSRRGEPVRPFASLGIVQIGGIAALCGKCGMPLAEMVAHAPALQSRFRLPVTVSRETDNPAAACRVSVWLWPDRSGPGFWTPAPAETLRPRKRRTRRGCRPRRS